MCLADAYLRQGSHKTLFLKEVVSITLDAKGLRLRALFGEEKYVRAIIREVDFMNSTVFLEESIHPKEKTE